MKPFKLCKCGRLCATGYCSECRTKDATARSIRIRERMDKNAKVGCQDEHRSNKEGQAL
jgi:hypothetical protein